MTKQKNVVNKKKHTKLLQQKKSKKAREKELNALKRKEIVLTMKGLDSEGFASEVDA